MDTKYWKSVVKLLFSIFIVINMKHIECTEDLTLLHDDKLIDHSSTSSVVGAKQEEPPQSVVKKDLKPYDGNFDKPEQQLQNKKLAEQKPKIIEDKFVEKQSQQVVRNQNLNTIVEEEHAQVKLPNEGNEVHIVKTDIGQGFLIDDMEMPDAYKAGFYFFFAISSIAIIFIVVRIYRLRLSRAERKYGVQGDRSKQELTPLPMAIEDFNSDDEDHTVFEINRQNIRIL